MTNKMRTMLLMDAIKRHDALKFHEGDCCVQARLAAQEMVKQAEQSEAPVTAVLAQAPKPAPAAPAAKPQAPAQRRTAPASDGRIASPAQIKYISDLLELRDVSNFWRTEARALILQDYPRHKDAQRILDQLTQMPKLPGAVRQPTPRMTALLSRLVEQKVWPDPVDVTGVSYEQCHLLIESLLAAPNKPRGERSDTPSRALPEEGIYLFEGSYYKIQIDVHGSGRKSCKKLQMGADGERSTFKRCGGMGGKITAEHKLSEADAKAFGKLYGQCVCCGQILTNEESIELGIGPVCRGKYF